MAGQEGTPLKKQIIQLAPETPEMNTANPVWGCIVSDSNKSGNIMREEVEYKVEKVLGDENLEARASELSYMHANKFQKQEKKGLMEELAA
ncbi:conserved hypothetical protein [Ricinus communis]|uniref:Uncharacterized protein n=1 Tax=Ricinus communis TaxID=3988 RepID=B9SJD9_RICCO|nr:conserved hypothetical protein [Ricinus communis]